MLGKTVNLSKFWDILNTPIYLYICNTRHIHYYKYRFCKRTKRIFACSWAGCMEEKVCKNHDFHMWPAQPHAKIRFSPAALEKEKSRNKIKIPNIEKLIHPPPFLHCPPVTVAIILILQSSPSSSSRRHHRRHCPLPVTARRHQEGRRQRIRVGEGRRRHARPAWPRPPRRVRSRGCRSGASRSVREREGGEEENERERRKWER